MLSLLWFMLRKYDVVLLLNGGFYVCVLLLDGGLILIIFVL